ncbi:hypothetical protein [Arsukibacterium sp. MJ3]|uniref:hypothetical protein n=1 Tax=Arsukibacterium sp. MJ3 TaxID=1632859 RepID=UPI00069A9DC8|nr:hypothetical protein [Arsukibacterium sp. MJ3]
MSNPFVSYLNSLHNVSANGTNALAESQAMSDYFPTIYEPFPIVKEVFDLLTSEAKRVVILTGHAGDGKSTVAIDVLKKLRNIPDHGKLGSPMQVREQIESAQVSIIKDMSELSKEERARWLTEAFQQEDSWLIVSNTGPLLSSLLDLALGRDEQIESKILSALNEPLELITTEKHRINGFEKELVIINLTRLDNVELGASLVTKLVQHSSWELCNTCQVNLKCPIKKNRDILLESIETVEERIRWIYTKLTAYEHRLTLRQILAHIAYSLTGGESCESAHESTNSEHALLDILFSEIFFGYKAGSNCEKANNLHAISLLRKHQYGAPVGVDFERQLTSSTGLDWAILPQELLDTTDTWRERGNDPRGARWRFALRRMNYVFGQPKESKHNESEYFLTSFLNSSGVHFFDKWKKLKGLDFTKSEMKKLTDLCLNVILEFFTGFSANQFSGAGHLFLTLQRKDQNVVQPTQLVIDTLPYKDFDLAYDNIARLPVLRFRKGLAVLPLSLPLFDYIQSRSKGELGSSLSPIYQSQIDWFQSELIRVTEAEREQDDDEITIIKAGINGNVSIHYFSLNSEQTVLEIAI